MTESEKLSSIIRHIKLVEDNCNIISKKMMNINPSFAVQIAKRGRMHDLSKFDSLEFEHLWPEQKCFQVALIHHRSNNSHHPEFYKNGIYGMDDLDLAEYVCDCVARSQEFGTDPRIWILDKAAKKYGYLDDEYIYNKLQMYINMILNKPFN